MSLEDKLNKLYLNVKQTLQKKDLDMYNLDETKTKCYYCDYNFEKQKMIAELLTECGRDTFKFGHLYSNFNDPYLIRNIGSYCDAVNRDSKEYCKKYNNEFRKYLDNLKEIGIYNKNRRSNF